MIEIPNECENTDEHLLMHLTCALEMLKIGDTDQAYHDINMAYCIMTNIEEMGKNNE